MDVFVADRSSQSEVRRIAEEVLQRGPGVASVREVVGTVQGARENVQAGNAAVDWNIRSVLWGHSLMDGLTDSGRYGDEETPIVIQLVLRETSAEPSASLTTTVGRHQATLEPQFPGVDDPALTVYWQVTVKEPEAAELQAELRDLPEVDGAYVKPPEEPA